VRLDGFPWTEFGGLAAEVRQVAEELRDGRVWVELDLLPVPPEKRAAIPLQHGLPGLVSVETERVSPATLLLRTLGHRATPPPSPLGPLSQRERGSSESQVGPPVFAFSDSLLSREVQRGGSGEEGRGGEGWVGEGG
jgi:hypothetical protein